ncbi:ApeA N-terminal domain 1-containing protein [Microvirga arabica]|uniref:ApeA N-terminal domain 1-containing protein n=1 Tax=Microvirga arabica TaxID=1128671 RepID=UPI00193AC343|nr:HEPN domain-containing protein [Microvirga arabica]MBM1169620.1 hypothetical protein [Microvirga arabica]
MRKWQVKSLTGEWWRLGQSEQKFRGVLELDDQDHGTLTLEGSWNDLSRMPHPFIGTLHGVILEESRHSEVTAFDVITSQGPTSSYPQSGSTSHATLFTNTIVIGSHLESKDDPLIMGAVFELTGLEHWSANTGFSQEVERGENDGIAAFTFRYRGQETAEYSVSPDIKIRFRTGFTSATSHRKATLEEHHTLGVSFGRAASINEVQNERYIWQSLLTFALREPSLCRSIQLSFESGAPKVEHPGRLIIPGPKDGSRERSFHFGKSLFNGDKLGARTEEILVKWRNLHQEIEMAISLMFGVAHNDETYIHTQLLNYLQAIEILHRELYKLSRFSQPEDRRATLTALRDAVPKHLDPSLRRYIHDQIGFIGSLTLLDRLKDLSRRYPSSVGPLFPLGDEDMVRLKDVRNFLTHYGDHPHFDRKFLWSREILVLLGKTRHFLEVCILGALGMTDAEIRSLLDNVEEYVMWKREPSP